MGKLILGIIVGFIVWSILWVGSDAVIAALLPNWYGKVLVDFQEAITKGTPYTVDSTILVLSLIRSVICSIIAGLLAVLISKEQAKTTIGLGILLLLFGIFVQSAIWSYYPLWYHLIFLILLIPITVLGGKLRKI